VQHSGYTDTWTPARRGAASFLAQSGRLVDLRDLTRGMVVDFTPAVTAALNGAPDGSDAWSYGSDTEMGGNLRWGVSANLTLDATVNPDFSHVEADVGQVSSNERFALFFPEKRPFFLEGIDRFDAPNRLIYTRRLQNPVTGVKLTGKVAGMNIGLLSGLDGAVPGSAGVDSNPWFNALRLQRDVGGQSTVGMVYTRRGGRLQPGGRRRHAPGLRGRLHDVPAGGRELHPVGRNDHRGAHLGGGLPAHRAPAGAQLSHQRHPP